MVALVSAPLRPTLSSHEGFTLIEVMVAMVILTIVTGVVLQGTISMTQLSDVVANRSEMHAGVRNATALLQQEVGQAGRVSLPAPVTLGAAVAGPGTATVAISPSVAGMFDGQFLLVDTRENTETIQVENVNAGGNEITATFGRAHAAGVPVTVVGGFRAGIVPPSDANGSTGTVLKIVGDVNGTGQMVYVEYTCDLGTGRLYRNAMPYDAATKAAVTIEQVLLDNLQPNPDGTPCFTYDERTIAGAGFVVGVAITLTARTQDPDPVTGQFQTETKALLNVAPRNVYHAWQLASLGFNNRIQPLPPATVALLSDVQSVQ